jgi:ribose-phosphate pyrophosphokinase
MIKVLANMNFATGVMSRDIGVKIGKFPGGEIDIKLDPCDTPMIRPDVTIVAHVSSSDLLIGLMLTADAVRRRWPGCAVRLFIPYLPYARQDRVCNEGEALSLAVVAQMINSINAETVTIVDAHSESAMTGINNCVNVNALDYIGKLHLPEGMVLIAPDAGALKKTYQYAKELKAAEVIVASKHRDPATGKISHTEIYGDVAGKDVMIFDDICDGGRTFMELSKKLDEKGAAKKTLFVTHGIFSHGYDQMAEHFDMIYSTNSFHGKGRGPLCPDGEVREGYHWIEV